MSLFDYASKVISEKVQEKSPMLSISMGMEPVMPMAQGGGLSTVQNSLNINGEPHRLAYINPDEESLLKQLGGSGRKIDGIPAYDDSVDGGSSQGGTDSGEEDSDPDSAEEGIGIGFGTTAEEDAAAVAVAQAEEAAVAAAIGEQDAYSDLAPDLGLYSTPDSVFATRDEFSRTPAPEVDVGILSGLLGILGGPVGGLVGKGLDEALGTSFSFSLGKGSPMGYGDTGTGSFDNTPDDIGDADDGQSAGDEIIREKIAAVKKVPVEEVTKEEVERAKRLTAAQRVAGTGLEEILNQIYGSGRGKGLLGIPSNT